MSNFEQLKYVFDTDKLFTEANSVIENAGWGDRYQIHLTHHPDTPQWFFGSKMTSKGCTQLNDFLKGSYIEETLNTIKKDYEVGRVRLMLLRKEKCYTLHSDSSRRIHIPLQTNRECLMIVGNEAVHMPEKTVWLADTTKLHSAMNGSYEKDRIHLLLDVI